MVEPEREVVHAKRSGFPFCHRPHHRVFGGSGVSTTRRHLDDRPSQAPEGQSVAGTIAAPGLRPTPTDWCVEDGQSPGQDPDGQTSFPFDVEALAKRDDRDRLLAFPAHVYASVVPQRSTRYSGWSSKGNSLVGWIPGSLDAVSAKWRLVLEAGASKGARPSGCSLRTNGFLDLPPQPDHYSRGGPISQLSPPLRSTGHELLSIGSGAAWSVSGPKLT